MYYAQWFVSNCTQWMENMQGKYLCIERFIGTYHHDYIYKQRNKTDRRISCGYTVPYSLSILIFITIFSLFFSFFQLEGIELKRFAYKVRGKMSSKIKKNRQHRCLVVYSLGRADEEELLCFSPLTLVSYFICLRFCLHFTPGMCSEYFIF